MKKLGCFFYKTACALSIGLMASSFIVVSTGNAATLHKPEIVGASTSNSPFLSSTATPKRPGNSAVIATPKRPGTAMSTERRRAAPGHDYHPQHPN